LIESGCVDGQQSLDAREHLAGDRLLLHLHLHCLQLDLGGVGTGTHAQLGHVSLLLPRPFLLVDAVEHLAAAGVVLGQSLELLHRDEVLLLLQLPRLPSLVVDSGVVVLQQVERGRRGGLGISERFLGRREGFLGVAVDVVTVLLEDVLVLTLLAKLTPPFCLFTQLLF
jgi:hypothetical protein